MSTRLQVVVDDAQMERIRRIAESEHMTVSEWVRQAIRAAQTEYPASDKDRKIMVVREAAGNLYPTADIDEMLREIDSGASGG